MVRRQPISFSFLQLGGRQKKAQATHRFPGLPFLRLFFFQLPSPYMLSQSFPQLGGHHKKLEVLARAPVLRLSSTSTLHFHFTSFYQCLFCSWVDARKKLKPLADFLDFHAGPFLQTLNILSNIFCSWVDATRSSKRSQTSWTSCLGVALLLLHTKRATLQARSSHSHSHSCSSTRSSSSSSRSSKHSSSSTSRVRLRVRVCSLEMMGVILHTKILRWQQAQEQQALEALILMG